MSINFYDDIHFDISKPFYLIREITGIILKPGSDFKNNWALNFFNSGANC